MRVRRAHRPVRGEEQSGGTGGRPAHHGAVYAAQAGPGGRRSTQGRTPPRADALRPSAASPPPGGTVSGRDCLHAWPHRPASQAVIPADVLAIPVPAYRGSPTAHVNTPYMAYG